jgi:hypothetical protein
MASIILILFCIFLCTLLVISSILNYVKQITILDTRSCLHKNGYIVKHNCVNSSTIYHIQLLWNQERYKDIYDLIRSDKELNNFIYSYLSRDFVFMDYIMFLENSVLHTCHRDNNAKRFNNLKHRSYTMLLYIDDMKNCLDIVPDSHYTLDNGIYSHDITHQFLCDSGSAILFDASLVHSGSLENNNGKTRRIQLKITHKNDIEALSYYDGYHKIINSPNTNSNTSKWIQKRISCTLPILADITQGNNRNYVKGNMSLWQKLFSKIAYSKSNYYDLQDVF